MSKTDVFVKMDDKGNLFREMPNGTLESMSVPSTRHMTDEQIEAAALSDSDAQPITPENEGKLQHIARTKTLSLHHADEQRRKK